MSGRKSRVKGHTFERWVVKRFREHGFEKAASTRQAAPLDDPLGIDLAFTGPFAVQCKAVEKLSVHAAMEEIKHGERVPLLFHKRSRRGVLVTMREEDFWGLINHSGLQP